MFNYQEWVTEVDPSILKAKFDFLLKECGFHIENYVEKHFEPYGFTSLYLLSESHFAIHTFPEHSKTYIELSSCIEQPYKRFLELMIKEADND
jgi:S-adenosylmethionine/arginine decarboxylase-like enzyme